MQKVALTQLTPSSSSSPALGELTIRQLDPSHSSIKVSQHAWML
jgi:hypothetical protein